MAHVILPRPNNPEIAVRLSDASPDMEVVPTHIAYYGGMVAVRNELDLTPAEEVAVAVYAVSPTACAAGKALGKSIYTIKSQTILARTRLGATSTPHAISTLFLNRSYRIVRPLNPIELLDQQRELLGYTASGISLPKVTDITGVATATLKKRSRRIQVLLGATTDREAVFSAYLRGMLPLEDDSSLVEA